MILMCARVCVCVYVRVLDAIILVLTGTALTRWKNKSEREN